MVASKFITSSLAAALALATAPRKLQSFGTARIQPVASGSS
jgi:hypothetical protein